MTLIKRLNVVKVKWYFLFSRKSMEKMIEDKHEKDSIETLWENEIFENGFIQFKAIEFHHISLEISSIGQWIKVIAGGRSEWQWEKRWPTQLSVVFHFVNAKNPQQPCFTLQFMMAFSSQETNGIFFLFGLSYAFCDILLKL